MKEDTDKNNFNIFREYVKQFMDYGKKFIVLGNMNAITYKEIVPYIKENKLWWGCSTTGSARNMWFICPDSYEADIKNDNYKEEGGKKMRRVQGIEWYTNIEHKKRNTPLDLYKRYSNEYPKYDNYDAIEVSKVAEIPADYNGVMGVPITFLDSYCPEQFEIIWLDGINTNEWRGRGPSLNGKNIYRRLFIRKRNA